MCVDRFSGDPPPRRADLRLVLEPSKGPGMHDPGPVALVVGADGAGVRCSRPDRGNQLRIGSEHSPLPGIHFASRVKITTGPRQVPSSSFSGGSPFRLVGCFTPEFPCLGPHVPPHQPRNIVDGQEHQQHRHPAAEKPVKEQKTRDSPLRNGSSRVPPTPTMTSAANVGSKRRSCPSQPLRAQDCQDKGQSPV